MGNKQSGYISPVASINGQAVEVGRFMKKVDIDEMTAETMNIREQLLEVANKEQKAKDKEEMEKAILHWTLAGAILTVIAVAIRK